eukprot:4315383-Prymnesium_polylepis.1
MHGRSCRTRRGTALGTRACVHYIFDTRTWEWPASLAQYHLSIANRNCGRGAMADVSERSEAAEALQRRAHLAQYARRVPRRLALGFGGRVHGIRCWREREDEREDEQSCEAVAHVCASRSSRRAAALFRRPREGNAARPRQIPNTVPVY